MFNRIDAASFEYFHKESINDKVQGLFCSTSHNSFHLSVSRSPASCSWRSLLREFHAALEEENLCRSRRGRRRRWQQPLIVSTADLHSRTGFPFRRLSVD